MYIVTFPKIHLRINIPNIRSTSRIQFIPLFIQGIYLLPKYYTGLPTVIL